MYEGWNGYTVYIYINIMMPSSSAWPCFSHSFPYIHHPLRPCLIHCTGWLKKGTADKQSLGYFLNACLCNWKILLFLRVMCFRCNTYTIFFPAIFREFKLCQWVLRTPSKNSWRSVHGGEADYWVELRSAPEKGGCFPRPFFFSLAVGSVKRRGVKG